MSFRPDLRPSAVLVGSLVGCVALVALAHVGMRTQLWLPISIVAAAAAWVCFRPFGRRFGVLDINAAQMSASAWVATLPAALLVLPRAIEKGDSLGDLAPFLLLAVGAALLGNATAGVLIRWTRGPEAFPFPLGQAVAEVVESPRRVGLPCVALLIGLLFSLLSTCWIGGWWPVRFQPSWGEANTLSVARELGADPSVQFTITTSVGVLALGIFLGARGLLLAVVAALAGVVWSPQALNSGWARFPAEAQAWLTPLALGLIGGAAIGVVLGGVRFASARGARKWIAWSGAVVGALVLCAGAFYLAPTHTPIRDAWVVARRIPDATLLVSPREGADGWTAEVYEGRVEEVDLGLVNVKQGANDLRVALHDGTTAEIKLYASEVTDPRTPLILGRHYSVQPERLRGSAEFLIMADQPARIYEQDELALIALDQVATMRADESFKAGFHPLPAGTGLPDDAVFYLALNQPIEAVALQPLTKWWTCVLGRQLPPGVHAELVRPEGSPLDLPARVRNDAGVMLRLWHTANDTQTELARFDVGTGYMLWDPLAVPANAAAQTPAFEVRCGSGAIPAQRTTRVFPQVLRRLEGYRFLPTTTGSIGAQPGVELGIYREITIPAGQFDRPLEGTVITLPSSPWDASDSVLAVLELPSRSVRAGDRLENLRALAPIPRSLEIGVRLVEIRNADGQSWRDAYQLVLSARGDADTEESELATALIETEGERNLDLKWTDREGVARRATLYRGPGPLFPGRYPSGRAEEAVLKFAVDGLRCKVMESGSLDAPIGPPLQVTYAALDASNKLGTVAIDASGIWHPQLDASMGLVALTDERLDPVALASSAKLRTQYVRQFRPSAVPAILEQRSALFTAAHRQGRIMAPGGRSIPLPVQPSSHASGLLEVDRDLFVVLPDDALGRSFATAWMPVMRQALLCVAIALLAAVVGMLIAGVGELLPWTIMAALLFAGLLRLPFVAYETLLMAFAGMIAMAHAADLGRDLKTGGIVGASAVRQVGLKLGLGLLLPIVTVGVVGWMILNWHWLTAPQASRFAVLSERMMAAPELYFSTPRLGAGALAGGAVAMVGFPGLGVLVGLGLLLPQAIALSLGAGAFLRVVAERLFARHDVRLWLLPFAAGLLLGETLGVLGAAAWLELKLMGV